MNAELQENQARKNSENALQATVKSNMIGWCMLFTSGGMCYSHHVDIQIVCSSQ